MKRVKYIGPNGCEYWGWSKPEGRDKNPDISTLENYRVEYGPWTKRAGLTGTWAKRMEFWMEGDQQMGAWRWEKLW